MDKKQESPKQAEELPEPLEDYEPEPLLKCKNPKRGEAKIGRPTKTAEEKQTSYREGRNRINARRNEDRRLLAEEKAKAKEAEAIKKAEEDKLKQEAHEEEIFQRRLKQMKERERREAEEEAAAKALELERTEKAQLIKRINELERQNPQKPTKPTPLQTPVKPIRRPRLYL
jgi:dTMP kinase